MKLDTLKAALKEGDMAYTGNCHDCGTNVTITAKVAKDGTIAIVGGAVYKIKQGAESVLFFKCDACFKEDKTLRNYQNCEVYSRAVGYLRPVQQWNAGKKEEFKTRKLFTNTEGT
jgi:anaerobic ribonucleoside-triphosphate reductase